MFAIFPKILIMRASSFYAQLMKYMPSNTPDTIVVKIGTESLFQGEGGGFGGEKIENLCSDISHILRKTADHVILVSSGAVGF